MALSSSPLSIGSTVRLLASTASEGDESEAPETGDEGKAAKPTAKRAVACTQTAQIQLEVKSGGNDFTIELKAKSN